MYQGGTSETNIWWFALYLCWNINLSTESLLWCLFRPLRIAAIHYCYFASWIHQASNESVDIFYVLCTILISCYILKHCYLELSNTMFSRSSRLASNRHSLRDWSMNKIHLVAWSNHRYIVEVRNLWSNIRVLLSYNDMYFPMIYVSCKCIHLAAHISLMALSTISHSDICLPSPHIYS